MADPTAEQTAGAAAAAAVETTAAPPRPSFWVRRGRPLIVAAAIIAVVVALPNTSLGRYLEYDEFSALVRSAGGWAPLFLVAVYAIGMVFLAPASLLGFAAAAVFGKAWAFVWVTIGVNIGAHTAFFVGRWAARDAVAQLVNRRRGWADKIGRLLETNGLITVLLLRAVFTPFNLFNYAAALTRLKWRDYAIGTAIGMLPVVTVWVLLGDVLGQVWAEQDIRPLWSWEAVAAAVVFLICVVTPLVLKGRGRL